MGMRIAAFALLSAVALAPNAQSAEWAPTGNVEMVVGSGAGGAVDLLARLLGKTWEQYGIVPKSVVVSNRTGAGFQNAIKYLADHPGDGSYLSLLGSSWISTAIQTNKKEVFESVTPIVRLFYTPMLFAVRADSPLKTAKDLADLIRTHPESVRFAISTSAGNVNHLGVLRFAATAGVDPMKMKVIVNTSGTESINQLLGGHIEVGVNSVGFINPLVKEGKLRILGIARSERLEAAPELPTLKEQGFDVDIVTSYTLAGPKGMTPEQIAFWENATRVAVEKPEVKAFIEKQSMTVDFVRHSDTSSATEEERNEITAKMRDLGIIQK